MKLLRYFLLWLSFFGVGANAFSQEDLLDLLEEEATEATFDYLAFKAMKIGNLQSTKVAQGGDMYMYVSHRFGTVKDGVSTFFGLDNANTKIQLVYGVWDGFQVGLSRESLRKTYAGSAKLKLAEQTDKFPFYLTAYGTVNLNTQLDEEIYPKMKYADRLSYTSQLLIARRFSNKFSLEIAPTFVRQNLVWEPFQEHNQYALGIGGRYRLTKRMSINADYVYNFSRAEQSVYNDPLTIGIDIETGGHVFQLLFSNAQSTNEPGFISNAEGDWNEGDVFFGFNIVRVF
ncbi:MAG: DUF5777 family beta-barrel protein [Chitinophagales bacterium]|nr:DUF5777 family beta-barrel protein [Chitinophagales bacterium]